MPLLKSSAPVKGSALLKSSAPLKKLALLPAGARSKWLVLVLWLLLAGVAAPLGAQLIGAQSNDITQWLPRGAESTKALETGRDHFGIGDVLPASIVYSRPGGITADDTGKAERDRAAFARYGGTPPPLSPSGDGRALLLTVPLTMQGADGFTRLVDDVKAIRHDAHADAPAGLDVQVTGPAGAAADQSAVFGGVDGPLLLTTVAVVAILLIVTYRSPVLWLVPLLTVGISSSLANAVVYLLVKHAGLVVTGQSTSVLTVLVFGAGTDYALLLIARYREELRRHEDRHEAMRSALRRTLPAVVASATTVTLGLLCLLAARMNSTRGLGPVAAIGIVVALVSITVLLPALLVILGRGLFWPFVPRRVWTGPGEPESGPWGRVGAAVARRPRPVWLASAVALAACAIGALGLHSGLSPSEAFTGKPESVTGQTVLAAHYPAGSSAPLDIYADAARAEQVTAAVHGLPGVAAVSPAQTSGDRLRIQALLSDPPGSKAAEATVGHIRTAVHDTADPGALIGGSTAQSLDVADTTTHDERLVMPLVLAVVLLVLMVLLRSLVAPVLLLASVVLSFGAALGASVLLFRALGHPHSDESLPLMGFLFLVALGVDYTIFMMTRAREETARIGHSRGVVRALAVTGGVITSAGLVLAATFAALGVLPSVGMLQLGVLVAVGVLLDTLVVRTLLVPALALDIGPRLWWPGRPGPARIPGPRNTAAASTPEPDGVR
ncbi:MMPL family transporter [Kitasatospora sp. NPDC057904]|uniref:MMPL family transporter n=1 Tax=Kitasatospora sp. NPDC057904 TaxID=3346275 RepID=UPI0036DE0DB9